MPEVVVLHTKTMPKKVRATAELGARVDAGRCVRNQLTHAHRRARCWTPSNRRGRMQVVVQSADGERHSYLAKGLEDLRMDERILQWMGAASDALARRHARDPSKQATVRLADDAGGLLTCSFRDRGRLACSPRAHWCGQAGKSPCASTLWCPLAPLAA